jgi:hypothetical protein
MINKLIHFLGLTPPSYGVSPFQGLHGIHILILGLTPPSYGVSPFQGFEKYYTFDPGLSL